MDLWLIRHGETDWNVNGRVQGWTDIPLNATGRSQAERLATYLKDVSFDHIYTSDLSRALATGQAVADKTGTPLTITQALREQYFGQAEGLFVADKERRFPNGVPDAETQEQLQSRIAQFLQHVAEDHPTGRVILATHGGIVRAALSWISGENSPIHNTSITCLRVDQGRFHVMTVNATPHLDTDSASSTAAGIS